MTGIGARLRASLRFDAINGNNHERGVVANQMREAADLLDKLHEQKVELVGVLQTLLSLHDAEVWTKDAWDETFEVARAALAAVGEEA